MNKKIIALHIFLLSIITVLIYSNVINGQFFFDDEHFIVRNPYLRDWSHIKDIFFTNVTSGIGFKDNFYRPLAIFIWLILNKIFGLEPAAFHLTSIFTHLSCGILIYFLLQKLFKNNVASFFGGAFFVVNPLNIEAVSYVSGVGDILSFAFLLLALYIFVKMKESHHKFPFFYYIIFCVSTFLAVLAKERAVTMIFLLPLFDILITTRWKVEGGRWKDGYSVFDTTKNLSKIRLATYSFTALVVAGWFLLRLTTLNFQSSFNFYQVQNIYSQNLFVRIFTFFYAFPIYIKFILIPYPLYMERTIPIFTNFLHPQVMFGFFLLLVGLIFAIKSFNKKRIFFFSYFWFLIALSPTSGIVPINALIMEHWLYFSMFGISVLVASCVTKYPTTKNIFVFCILVWGTLTFYQNRVWKNGYVFFQHILKYNPNSVAANNNFAMALVDNGELDKAIFHYKKAISLSDVFSQPHHNLARIYIGKNDLQSALSEYNRALEIDPNFVFTHQDLASIYKQLGDKQKAEYHRRRVEEILGGRE